MQSASQKDAPPHAYGGVRTVHHICLLRMCPCKLVFLLPGDLLGDTIHLMFSYLLLTGKPWMFMMIMRSCLKIDRFLSFSCPSVCSMICWVLPAQMFVPVAVQAVHPFPPPLHVSFLQWSSSLLSSCLVEVAKLVLFRLIGSFREVGKNPCWFLNSTRKLASA